MQSVNLVYSKNQVMVAWVVVFYLFVNFKTWLLNSVLLNNIYVVLFIKGRIVLSI
jgi:hypothetical protein